MRRRRPMCAPLAVILAVASAAPTIMAQQRAGAPDAPGSRAFEMAARRHYFAGVMRGDMDSFEKGEALVKERFDANPDDPEALNWHGVYTAARGLMASRTGEKDTGRELWQRGLEHMERSVELAPMDMGPRMGRASLLISVGIESYPFGDDDERRRVLETGTADMELVRLLTQPAWESFGTHERGNMLLLLAKAHAELGTIERARMFAESCVQEVPGSRYAAQAAGILERIEQGDVRRGDAPAADQPAPMESLFAAVFRVMIDHDLVEPKGVEARFAAFKSSLADAKGNPDTELSEFETFAKAHGGEAWSWFGAAAIIRSGRLFESGKWQPAIPIWENGKARLEQGVSDSDGAIGARFARGWIYAMVAQHEQDPAAGERMRDAAAKDLALVAEGLVEPGLADARASVLAGLASVEAQRGNTESAKEHAGRAKRAVESDRMRALIAGILEG